MAAPLLSIDEARAAVLRHAATGPETVPLDEALDRVLADHRPSKLVTADHTTTRPDRPTEHVA